MADFETLEKKIEDLTAAVAVGFKHVEERFDGVDERLENVETRLEGVETRLDKVEDRLERVENRLDTVAEMVQGHDTRITKLETAALPG